MQVEFTNGDDGFTRFKATIGAGTTVNVIDRHATEADADAYQAEFKALSDKPKFFTRKDKEKIAAARQKEREKERAAKLAAKEG